MKKVAKAARFLSQFNMRDIYYGNFSVYTSKNGEHVEGIGYMYGDGFEGDIHFKDFRNWSAQQYQDYIKDADNYFDDEPQDREVVCIAVDFQLSEDDEDIYILECTDFTTMNHFNRLIIERDNCDTIEIYLTPKESRKLHGTADVVKLCRRLPAERLVDFVDDLPLVVGG